MSEFYIGYLPKPPDGILRFLRRLAPVLFLLVIAIAAVLLAGQGPFADSQFEFGTVRHFEGIVRARPYALLQVARPAKTGSQPAYSEYLLVAPGKHGADDLVAAFDGQPVRLDGQLIYRANATMVEVVPGSIQSAGEPAAADATEDLSPVQLHGEIVDSKCYLGVMNPGSGKVHRDCAARCISGGIPPLFVNVANGEQFLLIGLDRMPLDTDKLRAFIAEPLKLSGETLQRGQTKLLAIDPATLQHTPDRLPAR
jgi:hypothetical protein